MAVRVGVVVAGEATLGALRVALGCTVEVNEGKVVGVPPKVLVGIADGVSVAGLVGSHGMLGAPGVSVSAGSGYPVGCSGMDVWPGSG